MDPFFGCVLIAYWIMRATGHLDALGTPGGLITGNGSSSSSSSGRTRAGGTAGSRGTGSSRTSSPSSSGWTSSPGGGTAGGWTSSRPAASSRRRMRQAQPFGSSSGKRGPLAWFRDRVEDVADYGSDAVTAAKRRRQRELQQAEWDRRRFPPGTDHRSAAVRRRDRRVTCPACGHLSLDRDTDGARGCQCDQCACGVQNRPRTPDGTPPNSGPRDLGRTADPTPAAPQPTPTPKGGDGASQPTDPTTSPAAPAADTEGTTPVTAPTNTNANVDRDAASIPAFYRLVNQFNADLAAMGEGLSAKDMDPASLAEFVELQEHAATVQTNVHMRHGNLLAAHQEAQHAAQRDAYLDQSA